MKKMKYFFSAVGFTGYNSYEKVTMSEAEAFMLENVEALAQNSEPMLLSNAQKTIRIDISKSSIHVLKSVRVVKISHR